MYELKKKQSTIKFNKSDTFFLHLWYEGSNMHIANKNLHSICEFKMQTDLQTQNTAAICK